MRGPRPRPGFRPGPTDAGQRHASSCARFAAGTLASGARLPSTRALAADPGQSRTTVTAAYEMLSAERYLVNAAGRVARVAGAAVLPATAAPQPEDVGSQLSTYGRRLLSFRAPAPSTPVPLDFLYGAVAAHDFPLRSWRRAVQAERARSQARLNYIELEGELALRLPREARLAGTAAALHAVLWLTARQATDEPAIVRAARAAGVGV